MKLPPLCLVVPFLKCSFSSNPQLPKSFTFVSTAHRIFSHKSQEALRCFCFLGECEVGSFCPGAAFTSELFHGGHYCPSPFTYCYILNSDLNGGVWGLQRFRCCFAFFQDLLDELSMCFWSCFIWKVHHCSVFSPCPSLDLEVWYQIWVQLVKPNLAFKKKKNK